MRNFLRPGAHHNLGLFLCHFLSPARLGLLLGYFLTVLLVVLALFLLLGRLPGLGDQFPLLPADLHVAPVMPRPSTSAQ